MACLTKHGMQGRRHALCWEFSKERTESSKELTDSEALDIITHLEGSTIKMRRKLISLCYDILWVDGSGKADVSRLDNWCQKFGKFKKKLNDHNTGELQLLISQFETFHDKALSS